MGEIAAEFNDVSFFLAACYKSQADLTYLSLQSQKVAFQHAPVVPQASHESMESAFSGAELQSTLYHTESGVRQGDGRTGEPMFAFAIKVSADTSKNIKVKGLSCNPISLYWQEKMLLSIFLLFIVGGGGGSRILEGF